MKHIMITFLILLSLFGLSFWVFSSTNNLSKNVTTLQPVKVGAKYVFEGGTLYHRDGCVPQLVVAGSPFQMGKQYGVLLKSEIQYTVKAVERLLTLIAKEKHLPLWIVRIYVHHKAAGIAKRLPERFLEEMKGVAAGSGLSYKEILLVNMIYDLERLTGCIGIVLKTPDGELYHGHTTDIGWGMEWPKTVMVQYHPDQYYSFTSITWAGFLGTQTAYNCKGLCYSENTLTAKQVNSKGFSVNFLARMMMEECASLEETTLLFKQYGTINGEALVVSDLRNDTAGIIETTPNSSPCWALIPMKDKVLWGINLYQNREFIKEFQDNFSTRNGFNTGRLKILQNCFNDSSQFSLNRMIELLRTSTGPDGQDYAKNAYVDGICNYSGLQMIIYASDSRGVYLATGNYYAARNTVIYYPEDFSVPPHMYQPAVTLEPAVEDSAKVLNSVYADKREYLAEWRKLAEKYQKENLIQTYAGWAAFGLNEMDYWAVKILSAYQLEPKLPENKLAAACVAFYKQQYLRVIKLLNNIEPEELGSIRNKTLRIGLLAYSYDALKQSEPGTQYHHQLVELYQNYKPLKSWLAGFLKRLS